MNKTIVKFKHVEDTSERGYIEAIYPFNPVQTLQLLKIADSIKLGDDYYTYEFCEFVPSTNKEILDVIYVYVDGYDEDYYIN